MKALSSLREHRASALEVAGFVILAMGCGMIYLPAGFIVAGLSAVFIAQGVGT